MNSSKKNRNKNRIWRAVIDWWYAEEEEPTQEEIDKAIQQKAKEDAEKLRTFEELVINAEFQEQNSITLRINKQLDPYDEIEISLHVIPLETKGQENVSLS